LPNRDGHKREAGAAYSKFSRYGEPIEKIKERSQSEIRMLTNQLFHYLIQPVENVSAFIEDTLYYLSDEYVMIWWLEGSVEMHLHEY